MRRYACGHAARYRTRAGPLSRLHRSVSAGLYETAPHSQRHARPAGPPRQRAVLAVLVINRNRPVGVESLINALWDQEPAPAAQASIQPYVSNLRRLIGNTGVDPHRVLTSAPPVLARRVKSVLPAEIRHRGGQLNTGVHGKLWAKCGHASPISSRDTELPPSWHCFGPGDMPLEAKRSRQFAVGIPEVRVSRGIAMSPRQQSP
jgi:hypothetical protein